MTAGSAHPTQAQIFCDSTVKNHQLCSGWDESTQEYVDWPNELYEPSKKVSSGVRLHEKLSEMAQRVEPAERVQDGIQAGMEASKRAADTWTEEQRQQVFDAIVAVAEREDEFTTDAIWAELDGKVPVTKGMTAMLRLAVKRDVLGNTGKTTISERGGKHDHGQRLSVWYSFVRKPGTP